MGAIYLVILDSFDRSVQNIGLPRYFVSVTSLIKTFSFSVVVAKFGGLTFLDVYVEVDHIHFSD